MSIDEIKSAAENLKLFNWSSLLHSQEVDAFVIRGIITRQQVALLQGQPNPEVFADAVIALCEQIKATRAREEGARRELIALKQIVDVVSELRAKEPA
jgi:hypothetical protein